jgi:hypothetical protein
MTMRTSQKTVTFRRPFSLSGLGEMQPAGTYAVETSEELLEDLSFPAWRRTGTVILLRPQAGGGVGQDLEIDPAELEAIEDSDALNLPDAAAEATLGDLLADGVLQQAVQSAGLSPTEFKTLLRELTARILAARLGRESRA